MALMKKNAKSIAYDKKFELIRINNWPDLKINEIWRPDSSVGYTQVPKIMPLFLHGIDSIQGHKKLSETYFALWCRATVGVVEVENEKTMALEAGFTGQRAVAAWKDRVFSLIDLKLIKTKPGYGNDFGFILIRNPYVLLHELQGIIDQGIYSTAIAKAVKLGAGKEIRGS